MSISLKQLSVNDLSHVLQQLASMEMCLDYTNFYSGYEVNWQMQRKMGPRDMYYFWSTNLSISLSWAENLAEFCTLFKGDQNVLFERNYALFSWLPVVYKCYQTGMENEGIPLGNGAYLPIKEADYSHIPDKWRNIYSKIAYRLVHEVVIQMRKIGMTYEEYLLFKLIALFTHHNLCYTIFSVDNLLTEDGVAVCEEVSQLLCRAVVLLRGESSREFLKEVVSILKSLADIGIMETDQLPDLLSSGKDWSVPEMPN